MIILKNITLKNFLSVGAVTQAVDLNKAELTLILGENIDLGGDGARNGVGKTTLVQALCYALFGVPINNIRKDNLVNRTNAKHMMVSLEFSVNGTEYKIERGRKPNILKFHINDNLHKGQDDAQGENKETQAEIERVIKMSVNMFRHIVALNTYSEPFLALSANDQRAIIEQLLGITLLSEKAETVKNLLRTSKDEIQQEEFRIKAVEEANVRIKEQIDSLKRRQKLWTIKHDEDVERLKTEILKLNKLNIEVELFGHKQLAIYNQKAKDIADLTKALNREKGDIERETKAVARIESEIVTLKEHKCHTCGQEFHDDAHTKVLADQEKLLAASKLSLKKHNAAAFELLAAIKEVGELEEAPKLFYATEQEAIEHKSAIANLSHQLSTKENEHDPYAEQVKDMEKNAIQPTTFDTINKLTKVMEHQKFLLDLLTSKDSFIRKKIIDQNLSYLNSRLTHYLDKIGLPHQVVFKNDLEVAITELGRDLDFDNLSRGERNRLILGLSFAFRDVWENLYIPINALFIDELIDSGLDTMGVENAIAILKDMARRRQKSIWLVSHREELAGRVASVLKVVKEGGFTSYAAAAEIE
jgi:DNA repair exonuclease SbcCD ATPase subunit